RAAAGLAAQRAGLVDRRLEVVVAVAKRHPALADRPAAPGLAVDPAIDRDQLLGRALDLDEAVHQDFAGAVHGDEIGGAVALAGNDDDAAGLQGDVGNRGFPTMRVVTRAGILTSFAWSTLTATTPGDGSAKAATGHNRMAIVNARTP